VCVQVHEMHVVEVNPMHVVEVNPMHVVEVHEMDGKQEGKVHETKNDSLYGRVKAARRESKGSVDFYKKLGEIVLGVLGRTVIWILLFALIVAFPIASIVLGFEYIDECRQEPNIPIYLIVFGIGSLFQCLLLTIFQNQDFMKDSCVNMIGEDRWKQLDRWPPFVWLRFFMAMYYIFGIIFLIIWFICGNVWVFRNYQGYYDYWGNFYYQYVIDCDETVYFFTFWLIGLTYLTPLACGCCSFCFFLCFSDK